MFLVLLVFLLLLIGQTNKLWELRLMFEPFFTLNNWSRVKATLFQTYLGDLKIRLSLYTQYRSNKVNFSIYLNFSNYFLDHICLIRRSVGEGWTPTWILGDFSKLETGGELLQSWVIYPLMKTRYFCNKVKFFLLSLIIGV